MAIYLGYHSNLLIILQHLLLHNQPLKFLKSSLRIFKDDQPLKFLKRSLRIFKERSKIRSLNQILEVIPLKFVESQEIVEEK